MNRMIAALIAMVAAAPAGADTWQPMPVADLAGLTVQYDSARQTFYASGRTLYDSGRPSWGTYRDQDGQYCSQWPPSDHWACYGLSRKGDKVRFVGDGNDVTVGVIE